MTEPLRIWAVADRRRGVENQAVGLATALAEKTGGNSYRALIRDDGLVTLPDSECPDVWIGCGRPAIEVARQHRNAYVNCRFVYVQNPRGHYELFDAIVAPEHDRLKQPNAISMTGSPNRLTAKVLEDGAAKFKAQLDAFPAPRIAMLIGGPNKRLKMSPDVCQCIVQRARDFLDQGYSVLITASRRTPAGLVAELSVLDEHPNCWVYDGKGDNPYFAFLALADWVFVTEDSTNMLTEAAFTGKPVYSLPLDGNPGKFRRLYAALESRGALRPFLGQLDRWTYVPLNETRRVANVLADRFSLQR